jgi:arginine deiminase
MPHRLSSLALVVLFLVTGKSLAGPCAAVGAAAEWLPARDILMHTPSDELFWGVLYPAAGLFERPFSTDAARKEYIQSRGIRVHLLEEVLVQGSDLGPPVEQRNKQLLELALKSAKLDVAQLPSGQREGAQRYFKENMAKLAPRDLVRVICLRPTVILRKTACNTGFVATYQTDPLMNLHFMRDQTITTSKGMILCKMSSEQRARETEVVKLALSNLGITPALEIKSRGRLEGGDYIPAGDMELIGQGLRTNAAAIQQILDANAFGAKRVVVVKDAWKHQQQMHLDTYFNVVDKDLAVLVQSRVDASRQRKAGEQRTQCDVHELWHGRYHKIRSDVDFVDYLEQDCGMQVIPVPDEDQKRYGINFLTIAPRTILAVAGQSTLYEKRLKEAGVKVTWIRLHHLTGGYGAAHCLTQVFRRCP